MPKPKGEIAMMHRQKYICQTCDKTFFATKLLIDVHKAECKSFHLSKALRRCGLEIASTNFTIIKNAYIPMQSHKTRVNKDKVPECQSQYWAPSWAVNITKRLNKDCSLDLVHFCLHILSRQKNVVDLTTILDSTITIVSFDMAIFNILHPLYLSRDYSCFRCARMSRKLLSHFSTQKV